MVLEGKEGRGEGGMVRVWIRVVLEGKEGRGEGRMVRAWKGREGYEGGRGCGVVF